MARPKGSKNKTRIVKANVDYAAVVAEKTAEKEKIRGIPQMAKKKELTKAERKETRLRKGKQWLLT